ncbi:beta-phosphoglucomutase [uncultured Eubacterium sp.]|uniref:beta-phosphoglucomutase n=1 Tax=uncultured Eubacterium sp. TaxID=165185 RepID=UPI00267250DE|nr:beta-phosphoglucomutase [uncultured Eubacterium sp.]
MQGVIFDLDGVLVSTDELHYQAWKKLADEIGISGFSREDNVRQRGVSRMASLEVVLEKGDKEYTEEEKIEMAERKNDYYKEMLQSLDDSAVLPGAYDTLKMLKDRGILTAVGSASKNAPLILEKTGILPLIDKISCGLDVTKSKPDPEVFLVAASKLELSPENCLVVEDAKAGVEAAEAGGMKSLGVGPLHEELGADFHSRTLATVENWEEILC